MVTILFLFRPTGKADGLSHHQIHDVQPGPQGLLWIGTRKGLNVFNPRTGRFNDEPLWQGVLQDFGDDHIYALHLDRHQGLWLGTLGNGLAHIHLATGEVRRFEQQSDDDQSLSGNHVTSIASDPQGRLWVGTLTGINQLDLATGKLNPAIKQTLNADTLTDNRIEALLPDSQNRLWIGTTNGLNRLDLASGRIDAFFKVDGPHRVFTDNAILSLFESADGRIWIGTQGGVRVFHPHSGQFSMFRNTGKASFEISSNTVPAIMADRGGVMWFGTDNGISKLSTMAANVSHAPFSAVDARCLKSWRITDSVVLNNQLWLGTFDAGLFKIDLDDFACTQFKQGPGALDSNYVMSLYSMGDGVIWVGTDNQGLHQLDTTTDQLVAMPLDVEKSQFISGVNAMAHDSNNRLWLAGRRLGVYQLDPVTQAVKPVALQDPASPNNIASMLIDVHDRIWLVYRNGAVEVFDRTGQKLGSLAVEQANRSRNRSTSQSMVEDDRSVWVTSDTCGLVAIDKRDFTTTRYCDDTLASVSSISHLSSDAKGFLWISTDRGLVRFDKAAGQFRYFATADGIPEHRYISAMVHPDSGMIHAVHNEGAVMFNPLNIPPIAATASQASALTGFRILNHEVEAFGEAGFSILGAAGIAFEHQDKMFSLTFTALEFSNPAVNEFAYRLVGHDADWLLTDAQFRRATYTNVPPGRYVFEVKARKRGGLWSEQVSRMPITVIPPWWLTDWFKLLAGLLVLMIVGAAYYFRTRAIRLENLRLEQEVSERTRETCRRKNRGGTAARQTQSRHCQYLP